MMVTSSNPVRMNKAGTTVVVHLPQDMHERLARRAKAEGKKLPRVIIDTLRESEAAKQAVLHLVEIPLLGEVR